MQETRIIYGRSVNLYQINDKNRGQYLDVYRVTSNFSELFETSEELWKAMSEPMGTEKDKTVRYIIDIKETNNTCGFINYDMEDGVPSIDIAIAKEYRHQGYGYDAAKSLCNYLLSRENIDCVYWFAMPNNKPSIKIAEKLGGKRTDDRKILAEAMAASFGKEVSEYDNLPSAVSYIIKA